MRGMVAPLYHNTSGRHSSQFREQFSKLSNTLHDVLWITARKIQPHRTINRMISDDRKRLARDECDLFLFNSDPKHYLHIYCPGQLYPQKHSVPWLIAAGSRREECHNRMKHCIRTST